MFRFVRRHQRARVFYVIPTNEDLAHAGLESYESLMRIYTVLYCAFCFQRNAFQIITTAMQTEMTGNSGSVELRLLTVFSIIVRRKA